MRSPSPQSFPSMYTQTPVRGAWFLLLWIGTVLTSSFVFPTLAYGQINPAAVGSAVDVLSESDTVSGPVDLAFPVDSEMTMVRIAVQSATGLTLTGPDGVPVTAASAGVTIAADLTGSTYTVTSPQPGNWRVQFTASGLYSLLVSGYGGVSISALDFVEERGRPGHEGAFPIAGNPIAGSQAMLQATLTASLDHPALNCGELRDKS